MSFSYSISLTDPYGLSQDAALRLDMAAAVDAWSRSIAGSGPLVAPPAASDIAAHVTAHDLFV